GRLIRIGHVGHHAAPFRGQRDGRARGWRAVPLGTGAGLHALTRRPARRGDPRCFGGGRRDRRRFPALRRASAGGRGSKNTCTHTGQSESRAHGRLDESEGRKFEARARKLWRHNAHAGGASAVRYGEPPLPFFFLKSPVARVATMAPMPMKATTSFT